MEYEELIAKAKADLERKVTEAKKKIDINAKGREKLEKDHMAHVNEARKRVDYRTDAKLDTLTKSVADINSFMEAMRINVINK